MTRGSWLDLPSHLAWLDQEGGRLLDFAAASRGEIGFLLVHGLLHLLGYDHETPGEAALMEERQEAVMQALGLSRARPA